MKTDKVYFAMLDITIDKQYTKDSGFRLCGIPLYDYKMFSKPLKPALVLYKTNEYGENIIIDLNTKQKYSLEVPSYIGTIFVNSKSLKPFNLITGNAKNNLPKRKILKMGNEAIEELIKAENEKNK